jgi:hypothetical protein
MNKWVYFTNTFYKLPVGKWHCIDKRTLCAEETDKGIKHTYITKCGLKLYFDPLSEELHSNPSGLICHKCRCAVKKESVG